MNEVQRSQPRAPVGSLVLIAIMYLPWLLYLVPRQPLESGESYFEFPGGFIIIFFGFFYLIAAIALAVRLYHHRNLSRAHRIAFYASLGILALFTTLIWKAT